MSLKSRNPLPLSAAIASLLLTLAGRACRTEAAVVDNTTLEVSGTANNAGLFGEIYLLDQQGVTGAEPALSTSAAASTNFTADGFPVLQTALNQVNRDRSGYSNVSFNNGSGFGPPFGGPPYSSFLSNGLVARWSGYIDLPAGVTTFATNSDDGSVVYIDGVRVVNNNLFQSNTRRIGQTTDFPEAGKHEIVIAYYQGTGTARIEARYMPGIATQIVDDTFPIIPVMNGGSQVLTGVQDTVLTPADGDVLFDLPGTTGGVHFMNALRVSMASLTFAGNNTYKYEGAAVRYDSTSFTGGGTNVLAASTASAFSQDIALGQLNDGGVPVRLQKTGPGQIVLDQTIEANTMSGSSVFEIRGGGLVLIGVSGGENPLGAAGIELAAPLPAPVPPGITVGPSVLSLTSKGGDVTFDNVVNVKASARVLAKEMGPSYTSLFGGPINTVLLPGGAVGVPNLPVFVPSATVTLSDTVTVDEAQTVTFQTADGYTLDLGGGVAGAGNVEFLPGSYTLSKPITNTGALTTSTSGPGWSFNYNVNAAFNNRPLVLSGSAARIRIGREVTSVGGDTFSIPATGVLSVPNAGVGSLFTRGGNLVAPPLSIIAESEAGGAKAVQNLGLNSDLFFGLGADVSDNIVVGSIPGFTPWRGVSTDLSPRTMSGGTITGLSNFQLGSAFASLSLAAVNFETPNGPVVASIGPDSWLRTAPGSGPVFDGNITFSVHSQFELSSGNALGNSPVAGENARVVVYPGGTLTPRQAGSMSGNVSLLQGATLQLGQPDVLGGIGSITGESGAIVRLQSADALNNSSAAQSLSTLPAGVIYQLEAAFEGGLPARTNPAGIFVIQNGYLANSVLLSAGIPTRHGGLSGLLITSEGATGAMLAGPITIGPGGGTLANTSVRAPIVVSPGGGRSLTIGTTLIVSSTIGLPAGGSFLMSDDNNWGSGADALANLYIAGGATLRNEIAGVTALPQGLGLAVHLGGVYEINEVSGAHAPTIELGQVTPQGGTIYLNRNPTALDPLRVNFNAPLNRLDTFGSGGRGSLVIRTAVGQTIGPIDKVTFARAADALPRVSGASGTINMVAPWMIGINATGITPGGTFLDLNPANATTTGFTPVAYVSVPSSGGTGNEIASTSTGKTILGPIKIAALRTGANISGQMITLTTGGLMFNSSTSRVVISAPINFGTTEGVLANVGGQRDEIIGALSGTNGVTKVGPYSLLLSNSASTLTGGVTVSEASLSPGIDNGIPRDNIITVNSGGKLDLNGFEQATRGIQGDGVIVNYGSSLKPLTLTSPNASEISDFSGTLLSGFGGLALIKQGPGTQILSGTFGYTGPTSVAGGTLVVDGISYASSPYGVSSGAILGGAGIIADSVSVTAGGTLAPGGVEPESRMASLRTGTLNLMSDANFSVELYDSVVGSGRGARTGYDQVDVIGTVSLDGANLQLELGYAPVFGDKLFIVNNDQLDPVIGTFGKLNGTPAALTEGSVFSVVSAFDGQTYEFRISYQGEYYGANANNVGNDVVLVAVPEPRSAMLLVPAAMGMAGKRRRRCSH